MMEAVFDATVVDSMGWTTQTRANMVTLVGRRRARPYVLLICQRPAGEVIGSLTLTASHGRPALGVILGPHGRGRGIGREALRAALPYFSTRRPQIVLETAEANTAMRRVADATGFVEESRYSHLLPNGTWVPAVRYLHQSPPSPPER